MLYSAGISLRSLRVNACGDKLLGKKTMSLIDFFGNLTPYIGQMERVILIHCQKATIPQGRHRMADAGL